MSPPVTIENAAFDNVEKETTERIRKLLSIGGNRTPDSFHRELGRIMWNQCGMARNEKGLRAALQQIPALREEFWKNLRVPGCGEDFNIALEHAGRVADFLEFAEVMCHDALERNESCGGHFREEYQTDDGEALRNDDEYCYSSVWEYQGVGNTPALHKESLTFDNVKLAVRSYK